MLKFDLNILWTLINLIFFYVLMRLFLFKPIKKVIDKRQEMINNEIESARRTNEIADEKLADYESRIADVQNEADKIIESAREEAKAEYGIILDRAENDAQKLKEDARKQMDAEAQAIRRSAREEFASLALEAAEKIVGKNVDASTNSDIFDEFLNESSVD